MSRLLWIRGEAFDHGVFNTSVRWTVPKVMDFMATLQQSVASTTLVQGTWIEATTTRCKPLLTEAEAVAYWHIFVVLQGAIADKADEWVDIRVIGVILMCQVFSPHRVRNDHLTKSVESWPSQANVSSPRHSPRGSSPRVTVSAQSGVSRSRDASAALLSFVRQHMGYFLQIACSAWAAEPANVSAEEFDLLGLILCAGPRFNQPLDRPSEGIAELATSQNMGMQNLRKLAEKSVVWNDEVYSSPDHSTQALDEPVAAKSLNITGLHKTTWFHRPSGDIDYLSIMSCNDSAIYVTSPVRFCVIAGCHDCTIIMTAVSAVCTIQGCEKISVHVASHCFKMENSIDSSVYLYCHIPPILTGDTRGIKLAPFNVMYSRMSSVLENAGMRLEPEYVDAWAHPVCCTLGSPDETLGGRSGNLDEQNNSTYHFVHPATFRPVIVPEPAAAARALPRPTLCLPQVYDDALKERAQELRNLHRQLAEVTDEGRRVLAQQAIQGHFREWLQATGKSRQLADLARMAQPGQATPVS